MVNERATRNDMWSVESTKAAFSAREDEAKAALRHFEQISLK